MTRARRSLLGIVSALLLGSTAGHAATIQIVNLDAPGVGFNDATAVAPIGGNPGTTRGAQRLNVFNKAAAIWGAILTSSVTIRVDATMTSLTPCDATSGVLGSTGTNQIFANFGGQEFNNTWYAGALANKQHGSDLNASSSDMLSRFNVDVDNATCLGAASWYYGYDHNEGTNIDLLAVVTHELAHGLGFASFVTLSNGSYPSGMSDVFTKFLYDDTQQLYWDQMTNAQRQASAINDQHLIWRGGRTMPRAPSFLSKRQFVRFEGAAAEGAGVSGDRQFGTAQFGPALTSPAVTGDLVYINDGVAPTGDGCEPSWSPSVVGKIALIDRGLCTFTQKAETAQDNGAIGVVIVNNVASPPIINMAGTSAFLTIPVVSITLADGNLVKTALTSGPVTAILGTRPPYLQGADDDGWPLMYAPTTLTPGSSVSHFDVTAFPDLLMEPAINPGLTNSVDLTQYVMEDIGWIPRVLAVDAPVTGEPLSVEAGAPNPFRVRTSIRYSLPQSGVTEMGIFDITGRLVKHVMPKSWQPAGRGSIIWDATNDDGVRVAPGVYLYRIRSNNDSQTQRVIVSD